MRKTLVAITTAFVIMGLAAGPAAAVQVGDGPPPSDPGETLVDLVDGLDEVASGSGTVVHDGPRGTAWTAATGVRIAGGPSGNPDLDLRLIETLVTSTTDHKRVRAPKNFARGEASLGSFFVRGVLENGGRPVLVPPEPMHGESYSGANSQRYCLDPNPTTCAEDQPVQLPTSATSMHPADVDWEKAGRDVQFAMSLVDGAAVYANDQAGRPLKTTPDGEEVIIPLPSGTQEVVAGAGSIVDGAVRPASIETRMNADGGAGSVESSVKRLAMLAGLTELNDAGPGRQTTTAGPSGASAETALLAIDDMTVLNTDALLRLLGIDSSQLPTATLAQLADALGINTGRFVGAVAGARSWGSVTEMVAGVKKLKEVAMAMAAGGGCDLLDAVVRDQAQKAGIEEPDCLDLLGTVASFADAVEKLEADVEAALLQSVGEESLIAIHKLNASVGTFAAVHPDGVVEMEAQTWGGIERIIAAGSETTLDLSGNVSQWNEHEQFINDKLCSTLALLGPEFCGVVRVRLVPRLAESERIVQETYAQATSQVDLMNVYINLPGRDAVEQAIENLMSSPAVTGATDLVDDTVPGGLPGGGGGTGLPLGRAAADDPLVITVGSLSAQSEHMDPGVKLDCAGGGLVCDSSTHRGRSWNPKTGFGGPGTSSDSNLPRTGGTNGALPIALAGVLGTVAVGLRRWLNYSIQQGPGGQTR